jgi:hypothetical protein
MLVISLLFFLFLSFFFSFTAVIRAESIRWRSGGPFAHVCVSFATFFFLLIFSFSRKWSVRFFFQIHSGLPFCHVDDCSPHSLFLKENLYRPVHFFMIVFFNKLTKWLCNLFECDSSFLSLETCHDFSATWCFFFSSSKVSINKNANRGQLQKRKENRVRDSRNFRKSHETCVIVGIKIGSSRQRKSRCIRTYNSRQRYKKKWVKQTLSFFDMYLTVYLIYSPSRFLSRSPFFLCSVVTVCVLGRLVRYVYLPQRKDLCNGWDSSTPWQTVPHRSLSSRRCLGFYTWEIEWEIAH